LFCEGETAYYSLHSFPVAAGRLLPQKKVEQEEQTMSSVCFQDKIMVELRALTSLKTYEFGLQGLHCKKVQRFSCP
jgi:hypothetical protein